MAKKNKRPPRKTFAQIQSAVKSQEENLEKRNVEISVPLKSSSDTRDFEWRFSKRYSHLKNKKYGWEKANFQKLLFDVIRTFSTHQKRKWIEIRQNAKKYHFHEVDFHRLPDEIQKFLQDNNATDGDLCQLGIDDSHRVIGMKVENVFNIVCNDENHEIYPMS